MPIDRNARLILSHGTHAPLESNGQSIIDCARKYRDAGIRGIELLNRVVSSTSASIGFVAPLLRRSGFDIGGGRETKGKRKKRA